MNFFGKNPHQQTSYSQTGEDIIVKFIFDQLQIFKPTYVDVGAHHPFYLSNTALFYSLGSRGINIEPDPDLFKAFLKHRPHDINLNVGISDAPGEADFYIISSPTLNTFSKEDAFNYTNEGDYHIANTVRTRVDSIKNILNDKYQGVFPQFLNLDAEGVDEMIVRSIDYQHNYPVVMCIETISFSTSGNGVKNTGLIDYVTSNGYMVYADTYINTIFVRENLFRKAV